MIKLEEILLLSTNVFAAFLISLITNFFLPQQFPAILEYTVETALRLVGQTCRADKPEV